MEILSYKEFEGSAELDMVRNVCRGKILHIDDLVTYESESIGDLKKRFEEAVDDYIATCSQIGKVPQKPWRGQFNVRVSPELHKAATRRAIADDTSLNDVVCKALEAYLVPAIASTSATATAIATATIKANIVHRPRVQAIYSQDICGQEVYGQTILGEPNSNAITVLIPQNAMDTPRIKAPRYWEAKGSQVEELTKEQETSHAH